MFLLNYFCWSFVCVYISNACCVYCTLTGADLWSAWAIVVTSCHWECLIKTIPTHSNISRGENEMVLSAIE